MASIVLSTVGQAVGTAVGGPIGGRIGAFVGSQIGGSIGGGSKRHYEGARLEQLVVQSSAYGRMVPMVFGTMRLAGNVIWARPLKEMQTTTTSSAGGGKGGGRRSATATSTSYSYYATLAIAVCEGEITRISRVWADAKLLDMSQGTYRIYRGTEMQMPDPLIESFEGVGRTPAYRGLAYVVIEDFPIGEFGNRIPNFSFEVVRHAPQKDHGAQPAEAMVKSVMMIPGSGEFVYDAVSQFKVTGTSAGSGFTQQGYRVPLNQHTAEGKANVQVAIDQMLQTFPNLEWVGVAVNWFGSSMNISTCTITPRVEYKDTVTTSPNSWSVAGFNRAGAPLVGMDGGRARYGGTPDDGSILRLLAALRARGLKIFFYPMLLMDIAGKPWRGELTGSSANVANFFTKAQGYNAFITHYANLVAGKVDAFTIGTEMRDLTKVTSSTGVFPAVAQFVSLAATVKGILGSGVKVTYAADWSEYHHTDGGWYHLDLLWASPNIDMVGIDAYFPLTDEVQVDYDIARIRQGWQSGEGYDWHYTDSGRTTKAPLAAAYAWKNIAWWWNNAHVNPNGASTSWVPGSKPIWFTEYGFASVDGCTNEPNVFVDASTSSSAYPRLSRGRVDFMAQRAAIVATEAEWAGSGMVVNKFLWTWDARPYPYWPDLASVWSDGGSWHAGHWVQGKLGASHVASVVEQVAAKVGIDAGKLECSALQMMLDGFVIHDRTTARGAISQLMQAYAFTLVEGREKVRAQLRDGGQSVEVPVAALIPMDVDGRQVPYVLERQEDLGLPETVEVHSLNRMQRYDTQVMRASRATQASRDTQVMRLGLVLSEAHATAIAEMELTERWAGRAMLTLQLPMQYAALEPGDVIALNEGAMTQRLRVEQMQLGRPGVLRVRTTRIEAEPWDGYIAPSPHSGGEALLPPAPTACALLDIPALPGDAQDSYPLRVASCGMAQGWTGASLVRLGSDGNDEIISETDLAAVMGSCLSVLPSSSGQRIDRKHTLEVMLLGEGSLSSVTEAAMLNGANAALVGLEIIQFSTAELLGDGHYRLSGLLRGRLGTERHVGTHAVNEPFVLLDSRLRTVPLTSAANGQSWQCSAVTFGASLASGAEFSQTLTAEPLRPYSPVHLSATREGGGDIRLKWVRRARIDGGWRDSVDIPLMEQREEYDVAVKNGGVVVRQWRTSNPEQVYSYADQLTDLGGAPDNLTMRVVQISALVGAGQAAEEFVAVR